MSRFMRQSKYRHVFADKPKKENSYENVKVSGSAWDTNLIAAGGRYISINWNVAGGGAFAILPLLSPFGAASNPVGLPSVPSKVPDILPLARGHSAPVLDTAWSPFDDSIVASAGEDGKVCVFKVADDDFALWGEDKWTPRDWEPETKINAGGRKAGQLLFHPTASNVLAVASGDHVVRVFDIENNGGGPKITLDSHDETIQGLTWNQTGTLLATTSRDKKLRIFDPRSGTAPVRIASGHAGVKGSRVVWLGGHDRIATTGFSRQSERQIKVWETGGLTEVKNITIDQSSGVLMPFYNDANSILFVAGKGDGNIRYYEYENDNLHFLSEFGAKDPQRGMTFLPRRALDVSENEVARAYKISGSTVEPLAFIVPRKAENFQADIFPPAVSSEPALTADEWLSGKTAQPNFISLEDGATPVAAPPAPASSFNKSAPQTPKSTLPPPTSSATLPPPETKKEAMPEPTEAVSTEPGPSLIEKVKEVILPSAPTTAEPEAKDLDVPAAEESDSEDEAPASAFPTLKEVGTPVSEPSQAAASIASAPVNGATDSKKDDEIKRLHDELRDSRAHIRKLELQVESMRANAHKIAQQLVAGLE